MKSLFDKEGDNQYLTKIDSKGNLLRSAEQFESGNWIISIYKGMDIGGEYSDSEFNKKYRKYFK